MTKSLIYQTRLRDLAATKRLAESLAPCLRTGDIIAFDGDLGAGKTELCRAIIHALGYAEDVPSPTFNLVQVYEPPVDDQETVAVWHFDFYRLEEPAEALELGIDDAFDQAVSLIEWPSRIGRYLPEDHLVVRLEIAGEGEERLLTVEGGRSWQRRLAGVFADD
ncbi:tRNA (adenosine(37)-N6)-threonylcarbamoyltransferase complex ATPase subunit type 1 TsaE [Emcibacter nanhaiensis]|uniref:tRNA threonylcarbamoyladenosine biosynthesis protein TsaE n=1 Tax=Emcibacter nanhaiensis TaxID=1505037 RepID=A0A501PN24_9PROT|nr:tRNA (adenosine(37)-N6)-threonylcarbamoyltransferase complex ATPase subunit type 1 TsaE [Emcibacter nanhaiensis]TPD61839.1 tRNA (adenosine(37)-N6)-threonylcarbamoyltransferase complex ATPase subunit type 1 TsaE [Emcibacter nanhaiensis]